MTGDQLYDIFLEATHCQGSSVDKIKAGLLAVYEAKTRWRYVPSKRLPDGAPVDPGTTIYAFDDRDGHWEYDLPPLPNARSDKS